MGFLANALVVHENGLHGCRTGSCSCLVSGLGPRTVPHPSHLLCRCFCLRREGSNRQCKASKGNIKVPLPQVFVSSAAPQAFEMLTAPCFLYANTVRWQWCQCWNGVVDRFSFHKVSCRRVRAFVGGEEGPLLLESAVCLVIGEE